ncbi:T9SS type A sorting domain-containing protein [Aureispira sp. CCB-E]|uniref:T9SS type A sorting domain-containing protein n=1 Tax=Aureispira sp. CCB-E TaxID=3051121 RepID=UPI0028687529|nr:T9SS type A sorting domain-containing protein [Aureispira sp. CCB-E]WMX16477.1 T9SS type A sorting domain-containing protein [Aureispira sp. CCB-E]
MKKTISLWMLTLLSIVSLQAQQFNCGVDAAAAAIIKQRMLANRQLFTKQQINSLMTSRAITYIPITIHNVRNTSGEGAISEDRILGFLCGLNAIYADQDIQFFIHGQINNLTNDFIDANSNTFQAKLAMFQNKVANTLNIYIGRSTFYPATGYTSYYEPNYDYVFLQEPMVSSAAKTEAHEIGHFFTLPHTFNGWEGTDAEIDYNGVNAPTHVPLTGALVEKVARGAGGNCATAADGFCDTEADYHSTALIQSCNFTPSTLDPTGVTLNPDESNYMSYYNDNCQNNFSIEQKGAIAMSVANRTWVTNTPPNTTTVTGVPTLVSPANNTPASIANSTVRLDWDNVTGATWYYLEVYGTQFPGIWLPNTNDVKFKGIITTGNSHYDLSTTGLTVGERYAWRVKAINQYSTCAGFASYNKFEATAATSIKDLSIEKQMTLKVSNNPITSNDVALSIYTAEEVVGSIQIYGMDGRVMVTLAKETIAKGDNLVQIPAANLTNGMYLVVVATDRGFLQQKFVIQR